MTENLQRLREELADIDQKLLELVAERSRLALEIGNAKREQRLPARDFKQEREVLERARATAEQVGLDLAKLKSDMASEIVAREVEANRLAAQKLGLNGTPAFLIGDRIILGAVDQNELVEHVRFAREQAQRQVAN